MNILNERFPLTGSAPRRNRQLAAACTVGAAVLILVPAGSTQTSGNANNGPAFDVALVKPAPLPSDGRFAVTSRFTPDGFYATYVTLRRCIEEAYDVRSYSRISGPDWITADSARYTISAKASGRVPESGLRAMLRTLLEDKFKLRLHTESREGPIYALSIGRKGLALTPLASEYTEADRDYGMRPNRQGLEAQHTSMDVFAQFLSGPLVELDRPVIDMTGAGGLFNFTLRYARNARGRAALEAGTGDSAPLIFDAIEDLGLRLEPRKGPIKYYVIDSAVRFTEGN